MPETPPRKLMNAKKLILIGIVFLLAVTGSAGEYATYEDYTLKQDCYNSSDGIMRFIDEGEGVPIVLLHGVPTSGWLYRKMIGDLTGKGFRVIVPDMLGFGNSDSPLGETVYSPENHAKRLVELMNFLEINQWTQVVHDAGAIWTAALLEKHPDRISKLVFLNSILDPSGVNWDKQIGTGLNARVGLTLQRYGLKKSSFVSDFISRNLVDLKLSKEEIKGYEYPIQEGKITAIFSHYAYMLEQFPFQTSRLKALQKSAIVIWGNADNVLKWQPQQAVVKQILQLDDAAIHQLSVGHLVPEEASAYVDSLIVDFVQPL